MTSRTIARIDIRNALDRIKHEAFGASDDDDEQRDAHLFRILSEVENVRNLVNRMDDEPPSEIREMATALAASGRPQ